MTTEETPRMAGDVHTINASESRRIVEETERENAERVYRERCAAREDPERDERTAEPEPTHFGAKSLEDGVDALNADAHAAHRRSEIVDQLTEGSHRCHINTTTADPFYPGCPGYIVECDECGPVGVPQDNPRDAHVIANRHEMVRGFERP